MNSTDIDKELQRFAKNAVKTLIPPAPLAFTSHPVRGFFLLEMAAEM
jgi:hypothetical protein